MSALHRLLGGLLGLSGAFGDLPAASSAAAGARSQQDQDAAQSRLEARQRAQAGFGLFEAGRFEEALVELDAAVLGDASMEPYLWQRGICQYYAERFEAGRRQFERHREVNGDDVENSAWHFLCTARHSGLPTARKAWLNIPLRGGRHPDTRVPLPEIDALFRGEATPEELLAVAQAQPGPRQRTAFFYAHLYLGLWHEVHGRPFDSLRHMRLCVEQYGMPGAMGDVARAHLRRRTGG